MYPIILLCGKAGSGKDHVADELSKSYNYFDKPIVKMAFADPVKRLVMQVFDIDENTLWGESKLRSNNCNATKEKVLAKLEIMLAHKELPFDIIELAKLSKIDPYKLYLNLKDWVNSFYNTRTEFTVRDILQELGTDWGRNYNEDMWHEYGLMVANKLLSGNYSYSQSLGFLKEKTANCNLVIISDGRFKNEILAVKRIGGIVCKIESEYSKDMEHQSETEIKEIPKLYFTSIYINNKSNKIDGLAFRLSQYLNH